MPTERPGKHDCAVPDPDVVADGDRPRAPPGEKLVLVPLARKIGAGAVGEVRLARPVHRVVAGIDPGHRGDRAELSDRRVGDVAVVDDIGVVVDLDFEQLASRADFGIGAEPAVADVGCRDGSRARS